MSGIDGCSDQRVRLSRPIPLRSFLSELPHSAGQVISPGGRATGHQAHRRQEELEISAGTSLATAALFMGRQKRVHPGGRLLDSERRPAIKRTDRYKSLDRIDEIIEATYR